MLMMNVDDATDPPAGVDQISDRTVPLLAPAPKVQIDPPSLIEAIDDDVLASAHTATMVLPEWLL
jgi:hypothetical protein